ncbi:hypothetical protein NG2371_00788 [Nocardia gamkensis]|nr:hypothetical protein [Nocardia gamkensis]
MRSAYDRRLNRSYVQDGGVARGVMSRARHATLRDRT